MRSDAERTRSESLPKALALAHLLPDRAASAVRVAGCRRSLALVLRVHGAVRWNLQPLAVEDRRIEWRGSSDLLTAATILAAAAWTHETRSHAARVAFHGKTSMPR